MVTENNDLSSTCASHASESVHVVEEGLSVTLLYSKVTRQVLCVETGKEFVDLLLGFLSLPMGCIIKLLGEASLLELPEVSSQDEKFGLNATTVSTQSVVNSSKSKDGRAAQQQQRVDNEWGSPLTSIANLYDSVARMEDAYLAVDRMLLLDPRPVAAFGGKLLPVSPQKVKKDKTIEYYCCGIACNFVCPKQGVKCPRHKRKMETPCKMVDEESEPQGQSKFGTGYAKEGQFIITKHLEIYPSSAIKSLMHLNMLKSERVSDLDNMEVFVGADEVLKLLKASLGSGNVLNKVFGKHCPRIPPSPFYNYRHRDKSLCRLCPTSAKAAYPSRPVGHGGC